MGTLLFFLFEWLLNEKRVNQFYSLLLHNNKILQLIFFAIQFDFNEKKITLIKFN